MIKRVIRYIANNFLLRNTIFAICGILVFLFIVNMWMAVSTRHGERLIVPQFTGKTIAQIRSTADSLELNLVVIDSIYFGGLAPGEILDQVPKAKSTVKSGRKIFLTINAERPRMAYIPYVTGFSLRQAKNVLENQGFQISKISYVSDIATNNVLGQMYNGRQISGENQVKAELGQGVVLTVGRNSSSPLPLVPKTIGLTLREAKSRIWEMGLNVGDIKVDNTIKGSDIDKGRVYRQIPNQQMRADYGAPVTLYLSLDNRKITDGSNVSDKEARNFAEIDTTLTENDEPTNE